MFDSYGGRSEGIRMSKLGRREILVRSSAFAGCLFTGLVTGREARAADADLAFDAVSMDDALRALGGIPAVGSQIVLTVPDLAENGAVVPVSVDCSLLGAREIFIVVEANPNPLCVRFTIPQGTEPFVATRIKMAESSKIYAVVRAGDKLYSTSRSTAVTVGGCG
jgi:sulfur-oxidizing protein SoxY